MKALCRLTAMPQEMNGERAQYLDLSSKACCKQLRLIYDHTHRFDMRPLCKLDISTSLYYVSGAFVDGGLPFLHSLCRILFFTIL
jgi:hypothetical protein